MKKLLLTTILAVCPLAAQNYTAFIPDVQIFPLLPDFTAMGTLPYDSTGGTADGFSEYGQATCFDGPFNQFGFQIAGRLTVRNYGYPNCGNAYYTADAIAESWRPDNVLDHLTQDWSAILDTSEPNSYNVVVYYEACSLISNVGLGQGGIYIQVRRPTICTNIPPGPPN